MAVRDSQNRREDVASLMLDVMRRARLKRRALLRSLGVTRAELGALHVLMHGDGLDMKELADRLEVSQPSATATVDALVRDGLAERLSDTRDGRVVHVHLTERSRGLIDRLRDMQVEQVTGLMGGLSEAEKKSLAGLFAKMIDQAEAASTPSPSDDSAGTDSQSADGSRTGSPSAGGSRTER